MATDDPITESATSQPKPKRSSGPQVVKAIRKIRHWKQRWDPRARFVWRKQTTWSSPGHKAVTFPPGSVLEDWVIESMGAAKLRRFWESHRIELLEFDVDTGRPTPPAPPPAAPAAKKASSKKTSSKKASTTKRAEG
jgi:hypothetical protein